MTEEEFRVFIKDHRMLANVMISEIESQYERAEVSMNFARQYLGDQKASEGQGKFWSNMQQLFESAAAISRILKPAISGRRSEEAQSISRLRGQALCYLFGVEESHLILNRDLRNRFAHIDEDIDDWWIESKRHNMSRRTMSPEDSLVGMLETHEVFEHFNLQTRKIIYRGKKYDVGETWIALTDIYNRACLGKQIVQEKFS